MARQQFGGWETEGTQNRIHQEPQEIHGSCGVQVRFLPVKDEAQVLEEIHRPADVVSESLCILCHDEEVI